jgi:uncharacterized protein YeaO (DUF488 family)
MTAMIRIRRAYDPPTGDDGFRVLVDRLWPRGLRKAEAEVDLWLRDIAPSSELRRWFDHEHSKWQGFRRRYAKELEAKQDVLRFLRAKSRNGNVTLVFGARDREFNNAVALRDILAPRRSGQRPKRVGGDPAVAQGPARGADRGPHRGRSAPATRLGRGDHRAGRGRRAEP